MKCLHYNINNGKCKDCGMMVYEILSEWRAIIRLITKIAMEKINTH